MVRTIIPQQPQEPSRKKEQRVLDLTHAVQLYPRVSTREQMKNVSTEMQLDISFARDYGWPEELIIMDPADLGLSGQKRMDERPAFLGMLGRIRDGIVKTVIAAQVDRFFREEFGVEYSKFMQICHDYDVKVVTLKHDRRAIDTVYDFHNSRDIEDFRDECVAAWRYIVKQIGRMHGARDELQQSGIWCCGSIAAGYIPDYRERINGKMNPDYYRYMPYDIHAERIRWASRRFRGLAANASALFEEIQRTPIFFPPFPTEIAELPFISRYGPKKIQDPTTLDENGKPAVLGYTISTIRGLKLMLTNPVYIGHWVVDNTIVKYNNHAPIVEMGDFMYALEHLSATNLDGTPNPRYQEKRNFYMKRYHSEEPTVLHNHLETSDPGYTIRRKTFPRCGKNTQGDIEVCYGFYSRERQQNDARYLIPAREVDGFFFHMFKQRLQQSNDFEGFLSREEKEKSEQQKMLEAIEMQISATEKILRDIERQLDSGRLTDLDLLGRANDNYAHHKGDLKRLKGQREQLLGQSTVAEKRRSYKELILDVIQYWKDGDVYPPEDLIPVHELPSIVDTFLEKVILDTLSPRIYRIAIHWRDPAWGIDVMACFRSGIPSVQWTEEEIALIREHYATSSREELMRLLPGRSYAGIQHKASRLGMAKRYTWNVEGLSLNLSWRDCEVAQQLGVTEGALMEEGRYVEIAGAKLVSWCGWCTMLRARSTRGNVFLIRRSRVSICGVSSADVCRGASRW